MIKIGGGKIEMSDDNEKISPVKAAGILAMVLIIIVGTIRLIQTSDTPAKDVKSRVPVQMIDGQQLIAMQQQVKDMQTEIAQLKATQPAPTPTATYSCQEPNVRCGPNEKTNPGVITDFGEYDLLTDSQSSDPYIGFNFTDRTGFSKRFYPVCPGQTLRSYGGPYTIMYHWRNWESNLTSKRGCYVIDGFQAN
jgi:hypothetical protein